MFAARSVYGALALGLSFASGLVADSAFAGAPAPELTGEATPDEGSDETVADNTPTPGPTPAVAPVPVGVTPAGPTTVVTTETPGSSESSRPFGGALSIETSVGIGTFVSEPQDNAVVTTSFLPSGYYKLAKDLHLTASFSLTWYQVLDFDTTLQDNDVLLSDISLGISHAKIFHDPGSKFNLSGNLRVGLPTSLASQFQNRLFTLSTGVTASIRVGPVSFSYSLGFGKYFNLTATPTVDCEDFSDPDECIQGRDANTNFGFESERRGPEVYLRGAGATSFYVQNALGISWAIIDELSLSLGVTISNAWGVRSFPEDGLSSDHAVGGRSQRDRLVSSLGLAYTINRHLAVGASLVTDTTQPFGATGDDFPVIFDFTRASDNITSLNVSVTGTL
jgi:hypothetical protein